MGTVVVPPDFPMDDLVRRVGGDRETTNYDTATQTLDVRGVDNATLTAARDGINARTALAESDDKRRVADAKRTAALQRHHDAILAADAVYQAELVAIAAAVTLADLDAI